MSKKHYEYSLLLAEDLRMEIDGKVSLIGIFQEGLTIPKVINEEYGILNLAGYVEFRDVKKRHLVTVQVIDAESNVLAEASVPPPEGDEELENVLVAGKFQNIRIASPGKYNYRVTIEDLIYERSFEIAFE